MTDKDKLEKVVAEIKRLKLKSEEDCDRQADLGLKGAASLSYGKAKACGELLSFFDSLEESN